MDSVQPRKPIISQLAVPPEYAKLSGRDDRKSDQVRKV